MLTKSNWQQIGGSMTAVQTGNDLSQRFEWQGFEATMLPHRMALYQSARAILGNATEADEAVQETYLEAWKSLHRFEQGTNSRAWLFAILFNVIRHQWRKWFTRIHLMDNPLTFDQTLTAEPVVPQTLEDKEILAALAEIPQQYSEIVLLADVEEFSYREISETIGIPIGTVMSRLSRGRALLRANLARAARDI